MDPKRTGNFIALLRKERGLTQKELADLLHVSDKAISRWETGKGFPETSLLMPLSNVLEVSVGELLSGERMVQEQIKQRTDQVIVQSIRRSERSTSVAICSAVCSVALVLLVLAWIILSAPKDISAMDFINSSDIYMLYPLGKDNTEPHTEYGGLIYQELDGGYAYDSPDGKQRYVFTYIPELSGEPVLSYMHCSVEGSSLFGVAVGESTLVKKNAVLGVEKDYSLMEYLKEQGFQGEYQEFQYGRRSLVYINGERCNWLFYYKDNVFINLLVSAHEGRRLLGFDIGILDAGLETILMEQIHGYRLIVKDPYDLLKPDVEEVQMAGNSIVLSAMKPPEGYKSLYLYVNGVCVGEFSTADDLIWSKTFTLTMPARETTILITPEKLGD